MKINIVKPFLPDINEIQEDFAGCLSSGLVTNNSKFVKTFEQDLQNYFQSKLTPVAFCNGELALYNLILAWKSKLGYGFHDTFDVLTPSFTFSGTTNAIIANNLRPVFCDIDDSLTLDINSIGELSKNTKMIVPVGVYGNMMDIQGIGKFAEENDLILIMDNAPAFGTKYMNKFPCHYGYSEIYSFHATKIFCSMEGGAAIVNDEEITEHLSNLRDFGQYEKIRGDVDIPGLNSKMQEISAIVGIMNLKKIDLILEKRKITISKYRDFFNNLESRGLLKNMRVDDNVFCPYLYFPIILEEEATEFVKYLDKNSIAARRYYTAVHTLKYYSKNFKEYDLSFTNKIKDRIVSLPIHTEMEDEEINYLFETIESYYNRR